MKIVSIDIETTGLNPEVHQIVEFAAIIIDLANPKPWAALPRFHRYVKEDNMVWSDKAIGMHARWLHIFKELDVEDTTLWCEPCYLGPLFSDWLDSNGIVRPVAAGKNFVGFDYQFLKRLPHMPEFHYRSIDPTILYMRPTDSVPPSLSTCLERAGLSSGDDHRALDDAWSVAQLIMRHWYEQTQ